MGNLFCQRRFANHRECAPQPAYQNSSTTIPTTISERPIWDRLAGGGDADFLIIDATSIVLRVAAV
jgi:hypothetical protein